VKRASISEAKNRLSALLDRVRQGHTVVIEDRGVPVARLEGLAGGPTPEGRLARLEREGIATRPAAALPASFFASAPRRPRHRRTASAVLIDERRDGR
jgi:prevent-host-death family protein